MIVIDNFITLYSLKSRILINFFFGGHCNKISLMEKYFITLLNINIKLDMRKVMI